MPWRAYWEFFEGREVGKLSGKVVSITESGDLVTDIKISDLESAPRDENLKIECEGHTTNGLFPTDHGQPEMTFVAFENESATVQISIIGGDASGFLGIKAGATVMITW